MSPTQVLYRSFLLLPIRHRLVYGSLIVAFCFSVLLDLIAILTVASLFSVLLKGESSLNLLDTIPDTFLPILNQIGVGPKFQVSTLTLFAVILFVLKTLLSMAIIKFNMNYLTSITLHESSVTFRSLLSKPLDFLNSKSSQDFNLAICSGLPAAIIVNLGSLLTLFGDVVLLTAILITLFFLSSQVAIGLIFGSLIILFFLNKGLSKIAIDASRTRVKTDLSSTQVIRDVIFSKREIQLCGKSTYYETKFFNLRRKNLEALAQSSWVAILPKYLMESTVILLLAIVVGVSESSGGTQTTIIGATLAASIRVFPGLLRIQSSTLSLQSNIGAAEIYLQLRSEISKEYDTVFQDHKSDAHLWADSFSPKLTIREVSYRYPAGNTSAISSFNLELDVDRISWGIVGSSGAGKSTLLDLIMGVIQPESGIVAYGNIAAPMVSKIWPGIFGVVPQDVHILSASLLENIAIGVPREEIDLDRVREVIDLSQLTSNFKHSQLTLESNLGEGEVRLSGGERQRLGLARALYAEPKILFLDEPTSSLDLETEWSLSESIRSLKQRISFITIAHRISTMSLMDKLIFLKDGRLCKTGTYEELLSTSEDFRKLMRYEMNYPRNS